MTAGLNNLLNRNVTANVGFIKSHLYNQKCSPSFFCNIVTLHISDHMGIDRSSRDTKLDLSKANQMYWAKKTLEPRILSIDEVYNMWCMVNCTAVMLRHRPALISFLKSRYFLEIHSPFLQQTDLNNQKCCSEIWTAEKQSTIGNWTFTIFDMPFKHSEK